MGKKEVYGVWRICTNQELMNLCRKGRLRWLENVESMPEEITLTLRFRNTQREKGLLERQER
jgi:hypothetical protein